MARPPATVRYRAVVRPVDRPRADLFAGRRRRRSGLRGRLRADRPGRAAPGWTWPGTGWAAPTTCAPGSSRPWTGSTTGAGCTTGWSTNPGCLAGTEPAIALPDEALAWFRVAVGRHYRVGFGAVGLNYYRDGRDSVAPHSDRELRHLDDTLVAILTLGAARPFLLRPQGGGRGHRPPPGVRRPAGHGRHLPGHVGARRARRWRPGPGPGSAPRSAGPAAPAAPNGSGRRPTAADRPAPVRAAGSRHPA